MGESGLPFGHPFGYLSFLNAFIHFGNKSVVYGCEFFKNQNQCMPGFFQFDTFLSVALSPSECMFT